MNSLIFAAGLGTRLKPLTDTMPKAMVPVNGRPLVQILIERLKAVGIREIVINVHHFAEQIVRFVEQNDSFGITIRFSDETDMLLETGGGLKKAARLFSNSDPILVHNVDILSNADLKALYSEATATTLLVSERKTQRYLLFDRNDRLVGWTNLATGQIKSPYPELKRHDGEIGYFQAPSTDLSSSTNRTVLPIKGEMPKAEGVSLYAFSGIQVFYPQLLPYMDAWEGKFSVIDFYLSICDKVEIKCRPDSNLRLLDVGKLDTIARAEEFLHEMNI